MVSKRIVLTFPQKLVDQPIVYKLVKEHGLAFNILQAKITPEEAGVMVLELKGTKEGYAAGIKYLTGIGVKVEPLGKDVIRDEARCTHCGAAFVMRRAIDGYSPASSASSISSAWALHVTH